MRQLNTGGSSLAADSAFLVNAAVFDEEAVLKEPGRTLAAAVLRFQRP